MTLKPVAPGPVGEVAEDDPQGVADDLSNPRHETDYESAGSEVSQGGAGDAPGPFVAHVGEEAGHADQQHEP